HVAVPPPSGVADLHRLVDSLFASSLDPAHPLWETYLIDGIAGGRSALLCKVHHAMIDGGSGAQGLPAMADPPPGGEGEGWRPAIPEPVHRRAGWRVPTIRPGELARYARDAVQALGTIAALIREPGSTLPFNGPITDARRIVWASFPLDDFLVARGAVGCK